MPDLPRISLVTPNLNGNRFLESCLRSVLDQGYPELEYVVVDGLSTDDSLTTITRFGSKLAHIVSEQDKGHYSAIKKGFRLSSGNIMGWLNSDDWLLPGSLRMVGEIFATYPDLRWLTTSHPLTMDSNSSLVRQRFIGGFNATTFYQCANLPFGNHYQRGNIQQESTFWRRSLWNDAGGSLSMNHGLAGDFELWSRFFKHADLHSVRSPIGAFCLHGDQLSIKSSAQYYNDAVGALTKHGGRFDVTPDLSSARL